MAAATDQTGRLSRRRRRPNCPGWSETALYRQSQTVGSIIEPEHLPPVRANVCIVAPGQSRRDGRPPPKEATETIGASQRGSTIARQSPTKLPRGPAGQRPSHMPCTQGFRNHGGYPYTDGCPDRPTAQRRRRRFRRRGIAPAAASSRLPGFDRGLGGGQSEPDGRDALRRWGPPDRYRAMPVAGGSRFPGTATSCPAQAPCARPASI